MWVKCWNICSSIIFTKNKTYVAQNWHHHVQIQRIPFSPAKQNYLFETTHPFDIDFNHIIKLQNKVIGRSKGRHVFYVRGWGSLLLKNQFVSWAVFFTILKATLTFMSKTYMLSCFFFFFFFGWWHGTGMQERSGQILPKMKM